MILSTIKREAAIPVKIQARKKPRSSQKQLRQRVAKVSAARQFEHASIQQLRTAKPEMKAARKSFKHAKKVAKRARREAKTAAKSLARKSKLPLKR